MEELNTKCEGCGQQMNMGIGCTVTTIVNQEEDEFDRVPYAPKDPMTICHDCNVTAGQYHHFGCDMEECPDCGGQLISCDCPWDDEDYEDCDDDCSECRGHDE